MKPTVGLIDYGAGNLFSVKNALRSLKCNVVTATHPEMLEGIDRVILPGVGAFPDGIKSLRELGFNTYLVEYVASGGYLLGICLGMQLMLSVGHEGETAKGLGLVEGEVKPLVPSFECRVPHIGWNDIYGNQMCEIDLFDNVEAHSSYYFVHSYHAVPLENIKVVFTDFCGERIVAAYQKNNLFGVQFHPEKSQKVGVRMLNNFIRLGT